MKKFLMTTAVALAMTTTAYAQSASVEYIQSAEADALMASNLLGARVYATKTDGEIAYSAGMETEWDDIGEINDVIVSRDGSIEGVVLGVGGFLGMGEKDVAVSMDDLRFVSDGADANDWFIVVTTTAEALEAAPTFTPAMEVNTTATDVSDDIPNTMENGDTDPQMTAPGAIDAEVDSELSADADVETREVETEIVSDTEVMADEAMNEVDEMAESTGDALENAGDTLENTGDAIAEETGQLATNVEESMDDTVAATQENLEEMDNPMAGFSEVDIASMTQDDLIGAEVYGANDENVGEVGDVMENGVLIEVGGFLGLGEKQVLVPLDDLSVMTDTDGEVRIYVNATEESLEAMPEFEAN